MYSLLPGAGLGFTGSKLIAFGLAPTVSTDVPIDDDPVAFWGGGGGGGGKVIVKKRMTVLDNAYSVSRDDEEILEILPVLIGVFDYE